MISDQSVATLIGDLVASKQHEDRRALQSSLGTALNWINGRMDPVQPLELTVGDEFQGAFSTVASAVRASMLLRLELLVREGGRDSRYGLGHGAVTVFDGDRSPSSQDGPGWWSAREAIDRAKKLANSPRTPFVRTCFGSWTEDDGGRHPDAGALEAFLICRDSTIDQMNERERRLLLGLLLGRPQGQLAAEEGVTQGAISQNLRRSGAFAIDAAHSRLDASPA